MREVVSGIGKSLLRFSASHQSTTDHFEHKAAFNQRDRRASPERPRYYDVGARLSALIRRGSSVVRAVADSTGRRWRLSPSKRLCREQSERGGIHVGDALFRLVS
jgi:hypothetical protein